MLLPPWRQCKEVITFYHDKDIEMIKLGCALTILGNTCLHKSTDAKFSPFTEIDIELFEKSREDVVCGFLSFLHTKQLLIKFSFGGLHVYVNQKSGLKLANHGRTQCANLCQLVFIRGGITIHRRADSHLDRTRPVPLKIRKQDKITKPRASIQQVDNTKLTADCFNVDRLCFDCNTVFEAMVCFFHSCPCHAFRPFLTEDDNQRGRKKRELIELGRNCV